jgi:hypothetical protein
VAWTTPRTWVAGELVTASIGNTHWRDNLDFLKSAVDAKGYTLQGRGGSVEGGVLNPADATTYYIGQGRLEHSTTAARRRILIPVAGTITKAYVSFSVEGTLGSNETSTFSLRLNNTSDTTVSASTKQDSAFESFPSGALSLAVVAGDYIEGKWVTPTWATNPTDIVISLVVFVRMS